MAPYKAQTYMYKVALHKKGVAIKKDPRDIQLQTIDDFQGSVAAVVLLDLVVTDCAGFVKQPNRLNVALTRAQDGLIVITDVISLYKHRKLVKDYTSCECAYLPDPNGRNVAITEVNEQDPDLQDTVPDTAIDEPKAAVTSDGPMNLTTSLKDVTQA